MLTFDGVRQMMAVAKAAGTLDAGTFTSLLAKLDAADASIQPALSPSHISDATRASLTQAVTRLRPRA